MNFHDLIYGKDTFFCVFCSAHRHISELEFAYDGIGVCKKCQQSLKTYNPVPLNRETEFCKTVVAAVPYTRMVRSAFINYKFNNNPGYSKVFIHYMIEFTERLNNEFTEKFTDFFDMATAVPLSFLRYKKRGYNQAELLAKGVAKHFDIPTDFNAVKKIRNTRPQSKTFGGKKRKNVSGVYVANPDIVAGKNILLFDDMYTTGNTTNSCASALKAAGAANISVMTFSSTAPVKRFDFYSYFR